MLRLSKMNDYAVVVLGRLAARPGCQSSAVELAETTGLPLATVSQVMKRLAHAGLVVSHRGARGGYALAREPRAISVAEIIGALEGPVALTACVDGAEGGCGVESLCPMRGSWDMVNGAIRTALEAVSLADMLAPMNPYPPRADIPAALPSVS